MSSMTTDEYIRLIFRGVYICDGGGGARVRKISKFLARSARKVAIYCPKLGMFSSLFIMLNLMVLSCLTLLFKPILGLHNEFFKLSIFFVGGNDMFATPIFSWGGGGGDCPQDRRLCSYSYRSDYYKMTIHTTLLQFRMEWAKFVYALFVQSYKMHK